MATLTGFQIKDTYPGLLKTDNNSGLTTNYINITDGTGNTLPILISKTATKFTGDIVLSGQSKIAFDDDPTNTYIQAGVDDPESIIINADRSIQLYTDENIDFYGGLTSPFHIAQMTFTGGSVPLMAVGGAVRSSGATLDVRGTLFSDRNLFKTDYTTSGGTQGDIIRLGSTTTTAGELYALSGSTWVLANRTNCDRLLAIAVGTNSGTDGMLIRGTTSHRAGTFSSADILYPSSSSGALNTLGSVTYGDIIRRVGVGLGGVQIYFNPEPYNRPETFYIGGGNETILTNWRREFGVTGGVNGVRVGTLGQDVLTTRQTGLTVNTSTMAPAAYFVQYFGVRNPAKGKVFAQFDLRVGGAPAYGKNLLWKIWSTPGAYTQDTTSALTWTLRAQQNMTTANSTIAMSRFNLITTDDIPENDLVMVTWGHNDAIDFSANTAMYYNFSLGVIPT